jgi:hypothetical protein
MSKRIRRPAQAPKRSRAKVAANSTTNAPARPRSKRCAASSTLRTAPALLAADDPWTAEAPAPQALPAELIAEGHDIPVARVQAMH